MCILCSAQLGPEEDVPASLAYLVSSSSGAYARGLLQQRSSAAESAYSDDQRDNGSATSAQRRPGLREMWERQQRQLPLALLTGFDSGASSHHRGPEEPNFGAHPRAMSLIHQQRQHNDLHNFDEAVATRMSSYNQHYNFRPTSDLAEQPSPSLHVRQNYHHQEQHIHMQRALESQPVPIFSSSSSNEFRNFTSDMEVAHHHHQQQQQQQQQTRQQNQQQETRRRASSYYYQHHQHHHAGGTGSRHQRGDSPSFYSSGIAPTNMATDNISENAPHGGGNNDTQMVHSRGTAAIVATNDSLSGGQPSAAATRTDMMASEQSNGRLLMSSQYGRFPAGTFSPDGAPNDRLRGAFDGTSRNPPQLQGYQQENPGATASTLPPYYSDATPPAEARPPLLFPWSQRLQQQAVGSNAPHDVTDYSNDATIAGGASSYANRIAALDAQQPQQPAAQQGKRPRLSKNSKRRLCQCGKRAPNFGMPGADRSTAQWCSACPTKDAKAVDLGSKKCVCGARRPTFGLPGETMKDARWCAKCPSRPVATSVDVVNKRCSCGRSQPSLGLKIEGQDPNIRSSKNAKWCALCPDKPPNAVDVVSKRCECGRCLPSFGPPGSHGKKAARWCSKCPTKPSNAVDVATKRCQCGQSKPTFGLPGGERKDAKWCAHCPNKASNAVDVVNTLCECGTRLPSLGLEGETRKSARWCASCPTKPPYAVNVIKRRRPTQAAAAASRGDSATKESAGATPAAAAAPGDDSATKESAEAAPRGNSATKESGAAPRGDSATKESAAEASAAAAAPRGNIATKEPGGAEAPAAADPKETTSSRGE